MTKNLKGALQNQSLPAYARNNNVQCALQRTMRSCWAINWSASQPLMDWLPSRFDTKSELNPHGGLVKDLIEP